MLLQIMSDIHLIHWRIGSHEKFLDDIKTDADMLVIAGDAFSLASNQLLWTKARIEELCYRYKYVMYVPGNHEFYGTSIDNGLFQAKLFAHEMPGFKLLTMGKVVVIDRQRFIGDTMWFPCSDAPKRLNDFDCISDFEPYVYEEHDRFVRFFDSELREGDIVVTHHTPSAKSIDVQFAGDECNDYFTVPAMEERFIVPRKPKLWIHGHTHANFDYKIGETRVVCNPRGYPGENRKFDPKMLIEV